MTDATAKDIEQDAAIKDLAGALGKLAVDVEGVRFAVAALRARLDAVERALDPLRPIGHAIDQIRRIGGKRDETEA